MRGGAYRASQTEGTASTEPRWGHRPLGEGGGREGEGGGVEGRGEERDEGERERVRRKEVGDRSINM